MSGTHSIVSVMGSCSELHVKKHCEATFGLGRDKRGD